MNDYDEGYPRTAAVSPRVARVSHTGSTNADLVVAAADTDAYPHLSVLFTEDQRSGRGRLDRSWEAPAGASLALSVVLRVAHLPVHARGWIPLAAGVAMRDAIVAQLRRKDVTVKWPNDVLVGDRKICGILAEATLAFDTVIVGSGVNTAMTAEQLPVPTATSFAVLGATCDLDRLMADYLISLDRALSTLADSGGDATVSGLRGAVGAACSTLGADVRVMLPGGGELLGTARALDAEGRLMVEPEGGGDLVVVGAGDVIHVRAIAGDAAPAQ